MNEYRRRPGERVGDGWRIPAADHRRKRHVKFDSNQWKSFLADGLTDGTIRLAGSDPEAHRQLADHLAAEYPVIVNAKGRTVKEWSLRAEGPDNHWLDCLLQSAVGAAMLGASPLRQATPKPATPPPAKRTPRRATPL